MIYPKHFRHDPGDGVDWVYIVARPESDNKFDALVALAEWLEEHPWRQVRSITPVYIGGYFGIHVVIDRDTHGWYREADNE